MKSYNYLGVLALSLLLIGCSGGGRIEKVIDNQTVLDSFILEAATSVSLQRLIYIKINSEEDICLNYSDNQYKVNKSICKISIKEFEKELLMIPRIRKKGILIEASSDISYAAIFPIIAIIQKHKLLNNTVFSKMTK